MSDDRDPYLDAPLAALPPPALGAAARARALEAGQAALARAHAPRGLDRWFGRLERGYGKLEPLLALLVAAIDLGWAASVVF